MKTFDTRVRVIASNCALKKCMCSETVNYAEETLSHIVSAGLRDWNMKARCMSQALIKQIAVLDSLVNFCTA